MGHTVRCGCCPFCRKDPKPVPSVVKEGLRWVLFNVFNPPPGNVNISSVDKPFTVDVLVEKIRTNKDAPNLILWSKSKGGIRPDTAKKIIFGLLTCGILQLNYHNIEKKAIFSLARSDTSPGAFALSDNSRWNKLDLK